MDAPSTLLPPLKRLDEYTAPELHCAIAKLVVLYLPEVRGTALVDEDIELLQADSFERSFAIRWLTGFISRGAEWAESAPEDSPPSPQSDPTTSTDSYDARTVALDRATALLAACAGTSASGALDRTFTFPTSSAPIEITLRDESLSAGDHMAVGLQTWGSAYVLGERVAKDPEAFGFVPSNDRRVLEIGAGTGLLSLLAGKLSVLDKERGGDGYTVVSTDYHPAVLDNLRTNVSSIFSAEGAVQVHPLDWALYTTGKATTNLSRAPSTATTPIGTPRVEEKTKAQVPHTSTSALPTPSACFSPPSPQTPKTPQTPRSPPPNLARAVFSRLMARGVKFEMPSTKPGELEFEKETDGSIQEQVETSTPADDRPLIPSGYQTELWVDQLDAALDALPSIGVKSQDAQCSAQPREPEAILCANLPSLSLDVPLSASVGSVDDTNSKTCLDVLSKVTCLDKRVGADGSSCQVPTVSTGLPEQGDRAENTLERETQVGKESSGSGYVRALSEPGSGADCTATAHSPFVSDQSAPFDKPFDVIFGADVIYELSHANLVHDVVERLLRKPSYAPALSPAYFHLIMPLRPTHADEATSVDRAFPRAEDVRARKIGEEVLAIVSTETYARSAGVGRADEVQYVYYRMGWV